MVRKFGPFDTSVFYEVENRRMQRAFNPQTGFVKTGQGAVTAGTGAQLVIAAYPDGALIDGLYVENPASETVAVTTNTGSTNPRIDRLVMRLDMGAKTIAPFQIVGTPAASPSAPALTNTATVVDMPLCRYTFPGSASAQNPASIVDERLYLPGAQGWRLAAVGQGGGTTNGAGQIVVSHALGVTPSHVYVQATTGAVANIANYIPSAENASTFTVTLYNSTNGAAIAGNPASFNWWAVVV